MPASEPVSAPTPTLHPIAQNKAVRTIEQRKEPMHPSSGGYTTAADLPDYEDSDDEQDSAGTVGDVNSNAGRESNQQDRDELAQNCCNCIGYAQDTSFTEAVDKIHHALIDYTIGNARESGSDASTALGMLAGLDDSNLIELYQLTYQDGQVDYVELPADHGTDDKYNLEAADNENGSEVADEEYDPNTEGDVNGLGAEEYEPNPISLLEEYGPFDARYGDAPVINYCRDKHGVMDDEDCPEDLGDGHGDVASDSSDESEENNTEIQLAQVPVFGWLMNRHTHHYPDNEETEYMQKVDRVYCALIDLVMSNAEGTDRNTLEEITALFHMDDDELIDYYWSRHAQGHIDVLEWPVELA